MQPVLRDLATAVGTAVALDPIGMGGLGAVRLRGTVHGTDGELGVQLVQEIPEHGAESPEATTDPGRRVRVEDLGVRPGGTGGRRRRRSADRTDEDEETEPGAPTAELPEEKLGLGDLLAGAMAAYRSL
jgi:hypothetical protein